MPSHRYTRLKRNPEEDALELQESLLQPEAAPDNQSTEANKIIQHDLKAPDDRRRKWFTSYPTGDFADHDRRKRKSRRIRLWSIGIVIFIGLCLLTRWAIQFFWPPRLSSEPWYPTPHGGSIKGWETSYRKASELVKQMTLPEKVNLTTGIGWSQGLCVGNTPAVKNFPALCYQDGPLGVRFADNITAFPAGVTVAATWNRKLMYARGAAHGKEARRKGVNVLLSPCMGPLGRHPAGGRNWEGFGTDPYLAGVSSSETIQGIQSAKVIATAKHFILNEQEHFRQALEWGPFNAISSNIDDRTLHELYLWPFADAVKAGVGSVMCAYQHVNNTFSCGNSKLMNGILKDELGFQGFIQSDWLAKRSGIPSALAGLDVDMPGDGTYWANGKSLWGSELTKAVLNGSLPIDRLNDMVTRIVAAWFQVGQDDKKLFPDDFGPNFSSWERTREGKLYFGSGELDQGVVNQFIDVQADHRKLVRQIAAEANCLLKNVDSILPLDSSKYKRIGIFGLDATVIPKGPNACADRGCNAGTLAMGWGSGSVELPYLISPFQAIEARLQGTEVNLTNVLVDAPLKKIRKEAIVQDLCLVFINSPAGEGYLSSDGVKGDRNNLVSPGDSMAKETVRNCKNTVVIIHTVGPVVVEGFADHVNLKGLIYAHLPGQEAGNSIADVLFGDVNPSGKLPYTVGKSLKDYGPEAGVMYKPNAFIPQANFKEGVYIDYRYFDKYDVEPRYEFGFGLSYTTFSLSNIKLDLKVKNKVAVPAPPPNLIKTPSYSTKIPSIGEALFPKNFRKINKYIYPYINSAREIDEGRKKFPNGYDIKRKPSPAGGGEGGNPALWEVLLDIEVSVENTGKVTGSEVVQLYVSFPENEPRLATGEDSTDAKDGKYWAKGEYVDFPVRQLRQFEKVELKPGEKKSIKLSIKRRDLSYWCVVRQNWILPTNGKFKFHVGASSRDLPLSVEW